MITNAEARDTYKAYYDTAIERLGQTRAKSTNLQETVSTQRHLIEKLEDELQTIYNMIDGYSEIYQACKKMRDEHLVAESQQVTEMAERFKRSIVHSEGVADIGANYQSSLTKTADQLDVMIQQLGSMIRDLEVKQDNVNHEKGQAESALRTARRDLEELDSQRSLITRAEECYFWYRFYAERCGAGENEDSGLAVI